MNCGVCGKKVSDLESGLEHAKKKHGMTEKEAAAERKLHAKQARRG